MRKASVDPDYRDAWLACRKPEPSCWGTDGTLIDMREKLDTLLKSGWSIAALKAYAFAYRHPRCDYITVGAWRWAVRFGHDGLARHFLERFNADPESYTAFVK